MLSTLVLLVSQITVPAESAVGTPCVATVAATVPDGATFDGGWSISCDEGCQAAHLPLAEPNTIGIWATPGTYHIKFSGFWLLTKKVTFKDGEGNDVEIVSYLGHGFIEESAEFTITGGVAPDPPNPPNPGGPYRIMMFYSGDQLDDLPKGQRQLLTSLVHRQALEKLGHNVLEILDARSFKDGVPIQHKPFTDAIAGDDLPRIAVAPLTGEGKVVDVALPGSYEALLAFLNDPSLEKAVRK